MTEDTTISEDISKSKKYIEQLSEKEKKILNKAKEILGSSFDINKSIGFQEWINTK